ncbi:MAG: tetratricopeptide repeat protein [Deltaproteobacteria bacterium]|nr:tetratricopeptide repeat protein [Deltaproteobacteria bacterium]
MVRHALVALLVLSACEGEPPPPDPFTLGYRAAIAGDHEAAAGHYRDATEERPGDIDAWMGLAREQLRAGKPVAASAAAREAADLDAGSADAHELLGRALLAAVTEPEEATEAPDQRRAMSSDRAARAAEAFVRVLRLDPERARIHFALGRAHELAGRHEEAAAAYDASAEAEVLPARSRVAAVRNRLSASAELAEERAAELRAELDAAEALTDDPDVRAAIASQRGAIGRMLAPPRDPGLAAARMEKDPGLLGALGSSEHALVEVMARDALDEDSLRDAFGGGVSTGLEGLGGFEGQRPRYPEGRGGGGTIEGLGGLGNAGDSLGGSISAMDED